ncbi:hypothetical protein FHL81_06210 [Agrobacterium tumefaciens]|nr:hypothetical protein FHL81_06210 [Agrobacterium tumefaciens]KWT81029.1 hypothetical protein ASH09_01480 [Agrobacterium radiobacter]KWT86675.1 hypothetical protein ASB65_03765 [Agrobacterium tumefaciens str. B6]TGE82847.1 hypothetical protein C9410_03835 [Rhizobium sp. SEMIA 439]KAB0458823.1 hypothetical protein F7R04_17360 [Agrobacterium tumefaciens]
MTDVNVNVKQSHAAFKRPRTGAATFIKRFFLIGIKQLLRLETVLIRSSQPNYEKAAFARNGHRMPATLLIRT